MLSIWNQCSLKLLHLLDQPFTANHSRNSNLYRILAHSCYATWVKTIKLVHCHGALDLNWDLIMPLQSIQDILYCLQIAKQPQPSYKSQLIQNDLAGRFKACPIKCSSSSYSSHTSPLFVNSCSNDGVRHLSLIHNLLC